MSQATSQLQQQNGMPAIAGSMANDATADATEQNMTPNVPAGTQQQAQDQFGAQMQDFQNQLGSFIASSAAQKHKASGSGGGAGGWLEAIAAAMGDALGQQASALVGLSNKLSGEVQTPGSTGTAAGGSSTGGTSAGSSSQSQSNSNTAQAQQFNEDMTQFQALSQQYSILQNTFTNAIQAIGTALQGMARKG
jgi:hypothetical protein